MDVTGVKILSDTTRTTGSTPSVGSVDYPAGTGIDPGGGGADDVDGPDDREGEEPEEKVDQDNQGVGGGAKDVSHYVVDSLN